MQEIGGDAKSGKQFFCAVTKKGTGKYPTASVLVSMALGERRGKGEGVRLSQGAHKSCRKIRTILPCTCCLDGARFFGWR